MKNPEFLQKIDWSLLKEQKLQLNDLIGRLNGDLKQYLKDGEEGLFKETQRDIDSLEGIVNLLDTIQDYAVDVMGINEDEVFYLTNDEI